MSRLRNLFYMRRSLRWLTLSLLLAGAVFWWQPGTGTVERHYHEIAAGMTEQKVLATLGKARDREIIVRLYYEEEKSQQCSVSVWQFSEWGRPLVVFVGFDSEGVVLLNQINKGTFKKFGHWLHDNERHWLIDPAPMRMEVVHDSMRGNEN